MRTFLFLLSLLIANSSYADSASYYCDIYQKKSNNLIYSGSCQFSQRQGYISIFIKNKKFESNYNFSPIQGLGNYMDNVHQAVYRNKGAVVSGMSFTLSKQVIYLRPLFNQYLE
ncbi:hypothetical protein L0B53_04800 [Vibrio sp. SS-MA-C1-2]|uniref:hypothetical protein n=1 Tax=Vibrio sp. SS-MA-C1-2 TaxID=2908646 RepID=UPI001F3053AE|nr:hypothetical protein [Vibrio sp. SS-MA-C1-2]UJF18934.1 hypothetical protein L0B53_04800 [Vibrio sp. SS-MA-C1-2]